MVQVIYRKERLDDYREGLDYLKASGMEVKAVVSDGFTGLKEMLSGTPYQLCLCLQQQRDKFDARQVHRFSQMLLHDRKKFAYFYDSTPQK